MKFWNEALTELKNGEHSFRAIYSLINARYYDCLFSEKVNGAGIESLTYGQLFALSDAVFFYLKREYPHKKGGVIAIDMPNCPHWVAAFWAILRLGCRPLLINSSLGDETKAYIVNECRAEITLTFKNQCAYCKSVDLHSVEVGNEKAYVCDGDWADEFILTTTGTTGLPKIIVHGGAGITAQILCSKDVLKRNRAVTYNGAGEVKLLAFLPFYHIFGLVATLLWFSFFGRTFVFVDSIDAESIRYACKRLSVTHFFAIPLVWNSVAEAVLREADKSGQRKKLEKAIDFSLALQKIFPAAGMKFSRFIFRRQRRKILGETPMFLISGGAPLSDTAKRVMNGLGYSLYNGYGLTEAGIVSAEVSKNVKKRLNNSVGKPFDGIAANIEDGLLTVSGPTLFIGTVEKGTVLLRESNEAFLTRDCAYKDAAGRITVLGRKDDMIILQNGENISPDEIENRLGVLPVDAYAVCGMKRGQKNTAALFVECEDTLRLNMALIRIFESIDKLPASMRPDSVYLCGRLPVMFGKIKRSEIRKLYETSPESFTRLTRTESVRSDVSIAVAAAVSKVKHCFSRVLCIHVEEIYDNSDFVSDLGGSSIDYFSLITEINKEFEISYDFSDGNYCVTPLAFAGKIADCINE